MFPAGKVISPKNEDCFHGYMESIGCVHWRLERKKKMRTLQALSGTMGQICIGVRDEPEWNRKE